MTDLTQKILSLDVEAASALNHANTVSMEVKREADLHAEHLREEAQHHFNEEKNSETIQLEHNLQEEKKRAVDDLHQKMARFDENIEMDVLVEHLLTVAKERICR